MVLDCDETGAPIKATSNIVATKELWSRCVEECVLEQAPGPEEPAEAARGGTGRGHGRFHPANLALTTSSNTPR